MKQPRWTFIDSHIHLWWHTGIASIAEFMKECGLDAVAVNSISCEGGKYMAQNASAMMLKAAHPGRVYFFAGLHHHLPAASKADADLARQARRMMELGADGIKMLEGKTTTRKALGLALDDPRFDGFYDYLQAEAIPLTFHVADPEEFWDEKLVPQFAREHGWFYDASFPPKQQLYDETLAVLRKFPRLKVTFAHFFFLSGDIALARRTMEQRPNIKIDITPGSEMYFNFSKDVAAWRQFFTDYQDRIVFGTDTTEDNSAPAPGDLSKPGSRLGWMRRFLATDERIEAFDGVMHGLTLDKKVCDKILAGNFLAGVGGPPRPLKLPLCREYLDWVLPLARRTPGAEEAVAEIQAVREKL